MRLLIPFIFAATPVAAEAPAIEAAEAYRQGASWQISVTLRHPDTGWEHYADGWRVEDAQGNVLGTRVLVHPHVSEQPFTRALSGVSVPVNATAVHIRARCLLDGWSEDTFRLHLP